MSRYRVYQLAKEFGLDTKQVIDILNKNKFKITNNFNLVGEKEREVIATIVNNKEHNNNKNTAKKNNQPNNQNANQNKNSGAVNNNRHKNNNGNGGNNQGSSRNNNHNSGHNKSGNNNAEHRQRNNKNAAMNNNNAKTGEKNERNDRMERGERAERTERNKNRNNKNSRNQNQNNGRNNNRPNNNKNNGKNNATANNKFGGNKKNKGKNAKQAPVEVKHQEIIRPKHIKVGETITVKELASKMTYPVTDVIKKLMLLGTMATINQELDFETASLIAEEFGIAVEELPPEVDLTEIPEVEDAPEKLQLRPPVVTVMGHVDHGKTSLLDAIRKTSVTSSEAGGITQHIGAYQVMCNGQKIVFLDTPGHEAFTAMRARGAQVTDIAVLVVAADDGVMPQTLEAINHAKAAKVPIVVAINKIDKPGANPDHVKQQLAEHELIPEEWGGQTIMVPVSAKKKTGISDLLEMILLVAEVQELKANPNREARGVIIEARLDKGRGPVASVLVQNGTLRIGDFIIAGTACGKVRAMVNDRGENVKKAGPSMPVEVLGLSDVPEAGDELAVLDEKLAKTIAEKRIEKQRNELMRSKKVSLDDLFNQINQGDIKELNLLVKADVQGSVEAVCSSLLALNKNESEVRVSIVHSGVGAVTESDVMLASAANALIIAFNVRPDANARKLADTEKIEIHTYRVIYEAIDDIQSAMKGMLAPKYKEVIQGKVEIRQVMKFSKALVAGSYVLEGKVCNNSKIRIIRDNIVLYEGQIESLRRFKDDVKEVAQGYECGITIDNYRDFREGDILEVYTMEEIPQK
ncbi:MAG TPA: translation initiation factor IF-2 [Megamonas hypermegale]|uniref:Translation initiation factor IF-2 n=1 Tax=Megamonas hypermegale TaxID=158847 RepID=A0A921HKF2_9FIRM|nr:translation initiation factor IF-2 [Megamonas hypermegale]HJF84065.1 translation initiation factor IF-2 [Megamonas hypermegale]